MVLSALVCNGLLLGLCVCVYVCGLGLWATSPFKPKTKKHTICLGHKCDRRCGAQLVYAQWHIRHTSPIVRQQTLFVYSCMLEGMCVPQTMFGFAFGWVGCCRGGKQTYFPYFRVVDAQWRELERLVVGRPFGTRSRRRDVDLHIFGREICIWSELERVSSDENKWSYAPHHRIYMCMCVFKLIRAEAYVFISIYWHIYIYRTEWDIGEQWLGWAAEKFE